MTHKLLDFENQEKGYEPFMVTRENIEANIGKKICYVDFVEPYRGTYFVRYGVIHSIRHSRIFLNDMEKEVDIRDIKEAGIEVQTQTKQP
jgi:hypothetical protein